MKPFAPRRGIEVPPIFNALTSLWLLGVGAVLMWQPIDESLGLACLIGAVVREALPARGRRTPAAAPPSTRSAAGTGPG